MGDRARSSGWDATHRERGDDVSWFESSPATSLRLLDGVPVDRTAGLIDVGGGASMLVDHLLVDGWTDLTVLDVSQVALDRARTRVGNHVPVDWVCADVTTWDPDRTFQVWHDRAVFHFLTAPEDQRAYLSLLDRCVPAGWIVLATFAPDGPDSCSGLPVVRRSAQELAALLPGADVVESLRHVHVTPWGTEQPFTYVVAHRS